VSAEWIGQTTARQIDFGGPISGVLDDGGYGFQWWLDASPTAYVAWGYGGQFIWVVPSRDLVVVAATHWGGIGYERAAEQARAVGSLIDDLVVTSAR
jgi:CubicO group peptidase (beta-lactamase class C family)